MADQSAPDQSPQQHPYGPAAAVPGRVPTGAAASVRSVGQRIGLGLPLLLIALAALVAAYVLPSLRTLQVSLEPGDALSADSGGFDNYRQLADHWFFGPGLLALAPPLLGTVVAGAVLAPLMAWAVHRSGSGVRLAARIAFALAAVAFAPAAMVVAWLFERISTGGPLNDAGLIDWFQMASGCAFGLAALVVLAAFRGGADTGKRAAPVVAAALTAFALTASGLQTFTFNYVTGIPAFPDVTPLQHLYLLGFLQGRTGIAAAGSILLLGALAALGIGAAVLFAAARTRIDVGSGPGEPRRFSAVPGVVSVLLLIAFGAGVALSLRPWLVRILGESGTRNDATTVLLDSWGAAGVTTAVAIAAALAGGYSLGALRPLGDGSRWLLLLFAPWLFVGSGPLMMANFEARWEVSGPGAFLNLAPRAWIAIPALFVFTALFHGLEDRRREAVAAGRRPTGMFAAAWPMVALVTLAVWLVNGQDVVWQLVSFTSDRPSPSQVLFQESFGFATEVEGRGVGIASPAVLLAVFAAAAVAAAVWYLPKVGLRVGRDRLPAPDPTLPLSMPRR